MKQWVVAFAIAGAVGSSALTVKAAEAAPQVIAHEGRLLDAAGHPLTGLNRVTFSLYAKQVGGAAVWSETVDVEFDDGYFDLWLGEAAPLDASLLDGKTRWLALAAGGVAASPTRVAVASTTHPMFAKDDDSVEPPTGAQDPPEPPAAAPGPGEPQRPTGVVIATGFADAPLGTQAIAREQRFIGATVTMAIEPAQMAIVAVSAGLGSTAPGGASDLQLSICTRRTGSSLLVEDQGARRENLTTAENSRQTFALKTRLRGLVPGEYEVGLCGHAKQDASRWNNNDMSRVTVMVATQ